MFFLFASVSSRGRYAGKSEGIGERAASLHSLVRSPFPQGPAPGSFVELEAAIMPGGPFVVGDTVVAHGYEYLPRTEPEHALSCCLVADPLLPPDVFTVRLQVQSDARGGARGNMP